MWGGELGAARAAAVGTGCQQPAEGAGRRAGAAHAGREKMKARALLSLSLHAGSRAGGQSVSPSWMAPFCSLLPPSEGISEIMDQLCGHLHQPVKGQRSLPTRVLSFHTCALHVPAAGEHVQGQCEEGFNWTRRTKTLHFLNYLGDDAVNSGRQKHKNPNSHSAL